MAWNPWLSSDGLLASLTMYTAVPAVWLLFAGQGAKSIGETSATPPWAGCAKCRHNDVFQLMFPGCVANPLVTPRKVCPSRRRFGRTRSTSEHAEGNFR